jgi:hypothetical protein
MVVFLIGGKFAVWGGCINLCHEPIQEAHDKIVVVTAMSVGEHQVALLQEVVLQRFPVIDGLYLLIDSLIHV